MYFRDLAMRHYAGTRVYLDLDGTLFADGDDDAAKAESDALTELARIADVYLLSNDPGPRVDALAERHGVHAVHNTVKKPDPRALGDAPATSAPKVVIGDKALTDGLFALAIGARFIKVDHITSPSDEQSVTIMYGIDDVAWAVMTFLTLVRARQWIKNLLVLTPLFFAGGFFNAAALWQVSMGAIALSLIASAGYIVNDIIDCAEDRMHATKCRRPIASGVVSIPMAWVYAVVLVVAALLVALPVPVVIPWILLYMLLSVVYTCFLKRIPVVEFITVSVFYYIRIAAGAVLAAVPLSGWFILVTFFATLFITVSKRFSESARGKARAVLAAYPPAFLNALPLITGTMTLVAYALYSLSPAAHAGMVYTNIFVLFGILWYLRGVYLNADGEHPEEKLWRDVGLLAAIIGWGLSLLVLLYTY